MRKWLIASLVGLLGLFTFAGCALTGNKDSETKDVYTVTFELCTTLETNMVDPQEVAPGDVAFKPSVGIIGDNPDRLEVDGWYTDKDYTNAWNFTTDVVESDMTLYAKWVKKFAVNYYLGEDVENIMFTDYVKEGSCPTRLDQLADGYESKGFFTTAMHKVEFDFSQPITKDVNVYIHRSEHIYFTGKMIAERFEMFAAPSGPNSTVGTIEYVEDETDGGYAKMNFGYSTAADPHALLRNVTVDISGSQKLEVTFRYMGDAQYLTFYYLNWMADGSYTDGQSFNENNTFRYKHDPADKGKWVTKVFDFSSVLNNGVSNWAISSTLIQLRLQSSYVSKSPDDLSNELHIKSIKGIPDETYKSTEDSKHIQEMLVNDDATAVDKVASAQEDVTGWIFPKDYSQAVANNAEIYEKTNGLLLYSAFRAVGSSVSFKIPKGESINLDDKTTIRIRLTNYGYANKITLQYCNSFGDIRTKDLKIAPCENNTPVSQEYVLNMFGAERYKGTLASVGFAYDSIGINNAVLIELVEFADFKIVEIPGVSFNDKYAGLADKTPFWTTQENVILQHNGGTLANGGTIFTVGENAYIAKDTVITNRGYETMTLKYKDVEGVTGVKVSLTINGVAKEYLFDVTKDVKTFAAGEDAVYSAGDVKANGDWREIFLPFEATGDIKNVKVDFIGSGMITIQELRFNMNKNTGLDFSDSTYIDYMVQRNWSGDIIAYDNGLSAMNLSSKMVNGNSMSALYYYGAMLEGAQPFGEGNFDISQKSKLVVVYYNPGKVAKLNVALGLIKTDAENWQSTITQPYGDTSGHAQTLDLRTEMAEGEWASVEIDLTKYKTLSEQGSTLGQAITVILLQQAVVSADNLFIRSVSII